MLHTVPFQLLAASCIIFSCITENAENLGFGFLPKKILCSVFVLALMQVGILNPDLLCDPVPRLRLPGSELSNATSGLLKF